MRSIGNVQQDGQVRAIASGALTNGATAVVNSDGTVSAVSGSTITAAVGSATVFESAWSLHMAATYDANAQKVVIAYFDEGTTNYGRAVVGTVSGTSISFGTPVNFRTARVSNIGIAYDANAQKVVIVYNLDASSLGTAVVGTVSGTSISFGSSTTFNSAFSDYNFPIYDSTTQKVVVAYNDLATTSGKAIVGTVSGTSISFGSEVEFETGRVRDISGAYDSNAQKVVISYYDDTNLDYGTAVVGTVSGTSISFGTPVVFNSADTADTSVVYDSNAQKVVIAYTDNSASRGTAIVGTVSGTSISFGTPVVFSVQTTLYNIATYDTAAQKVVIAFADVNNSYYGTVISGKVSGTSISFDSSTVWGSFSATDFGITYDANAEKVVIPYKATSTNYGTGIVFRTGYVDTNLTAENFIGFADDGYADTQSAAINSTCSVDRNQSGLTAGQKYYVQVDGTLGLTADDPSVEAGTAISATEILVKG